MLSSILRFIKKLMIIVCCLLAIFIGALFAYENPEKISPVFWGLKLPALSLGYYLIFIFILGLVIGGAFTFFSAQSKIFGVQKKNKKLVRQVKALEPTENTP